MATSQTQLEVVIKAEDLASSTLKALTSKAGDLGKQFKITADGMSDVMSKVGKVGSAAFGSLTGALSLSLYKFSELGDQVQKMAIKTGFSTEALSGLKFAAEQSGASIEQLEIGVKSMSKFLEQANDESNNLAKTMSVQLAKGTEELAKKKEDLTKRIKKTEEALSELDTGSKGYAKRAKGLKDDIKDMRKELEDLGDEVKISNTSVGTYTETLKKLGFSIDDLKGLSPEDTFMKLASGIAGIADPLRRSAVAMDIFGKSGSDLIPLFNEGPEGMQKLMDKAKELGIVFDQEAADKAAKLNDTINELKQSLSGVSKTIAEILSPMVVDFVQNTLQPLIIKFREWIEKNPDLAQTLLGVAVSISAVMAFMLPLSLILPPIVNGFTMFSTALKTVTVTGTLAAAKFLLIVVLLGIIGVAIYDLAKNWTDVWDIITITIGESANFIQSMIEGIVNTVIDGVNIMIRAVNKVSSQIAKVPGFKGVSKSLQISEIDRVSFDRYDTGAIYNEMMSRPAQQTLAGSIVNITGNTFLDEDTAQKIGDMIISKFKLNTKL